MELTLKSFTNEELIARYIEVERKLPGITVRWEMINHLYWSQCLREELSKRNMKIPRRTEIK